MSRYADRYGIPAEEIGRLGSRYRGQKLAEGFGSFDNFLRFCAEVGYQSGMRMNKYYQDEPHSPENTYFCKKAIPGIKKEKNEEKTKNWICADCDKTSCTASGAGCPRYRKLWTENWNKNIHRKRSAPQEVSPNRKQYFQYEHPDLVREGIVFRTDKV